MTTQTHADGTGESEAAMEPHGAVMCQSLKRMISVLHQLLMRLIGSNKETKTFVKPSERIHDFAGFSPGPPNINVGVRFVVRQEVKPRGAQRPDPAAPRSSAVTPHKKKPEPINV